MKHSQTAKRNGIMAAVLLLAIALTVCVTLLIVNLWQGQNAGESNWSTLAASGAAVQDWVGDRSSYTGEKNTDTISIPGFDFLNFKANTEEQTVNFYNPPANTCYFKISLIVNNETLWQSPLLAPGKAVYDIKMDQTLGSGEYDATLKYECFADAAAEAELNGSEIGVVLKVL